MGEGNEDAAGGSERSGGLLLILEWTRLIMGYLFMGPTDQSQDTSRGSSHDLHAYASGGGFIIEQGRYRSLYYQRPLKGAGRESPIQCVPIH